MSTRRRHTRTALAALVLAMLATATGGAAPANVAVTPLVPETDQLQQPSVARDPVRPGHLAIAYHDHQGLGYRATACLLALSTDGGETWANRVLVGPGGVYPPPPETEDGQPRCANPVIAYGPEGNLYYAFQTVDISFQGVVYLVTSPDGGATFRAPVPVRPLPPAAGSGDNGARMDSLPDLAVDSNTGRLYATWTRAIDGPVDSYQIMLSRSDDAGRTFSDPIGIGRPPAPTVHSAARGSRIAVAGDGTVHLSWIDSTDADRLSFAGLVLYIGETFILGGPLPRYTLPVEIIPPRVLLHASSRDGGDTFSPPAEVGLIYPACQMFERPICDRLHYQLDGWWAQAIAVAPNSRDVYITWWDPREGRDRNRVVLSASHDGGGSWSAARVIGAEGLGDHQQHRPWVSVSRGGRVDVAYYDLRPDQVLQDVYTILSHDGGSTFSSPQLVTSVPSDVRIGNPTVPGIPTAEFGQHLGLVSTDEAALVAWTDSRRGSPNTNHQDVFFARAPAPL